MKAWLGEGLAGVFGPTTDEHGIITLDSAHTLGHLRWFVGGYQDYEDWRKKEFGTGLFENRRNRYRKLVRG